MANQDITLIPIAKLQFDPENPRLPNQVLEDGSEKRVLEYMISNGNIIDLMLSISESGFFDGEPILIFPNPKEKGKFLVAEGNRRLAAVKLLLNPELAINKKNTFTSIVNEAKHIPTEIPCIIYDKREDVLDFLGYRHITGIDEWDSLMKAKYLKQLYGHYSLSESEPSKIHTILAKKIGKRTDVVNKLLKGYGYYEIIEKADFYEIANLNDANFSFSLLTTALSYSNISDFVEGADGNTINEENLKDLTKWMFEKSDGNTVLGESRNLKILNSIVAAPAALVRLKKGSSLSEAELFSEHPGKIFLNTISTAVKRLEDAKVISHHANDFLPQALEKIEAVKEIARELSILIKIKLDSKD